MKYFYLLVAFLLMAVLPSVSHAQERGLELKEGETLINLSATETMKLKQDLLVASLRIEADAKTAKDVQDKINKKMAEAMSIAKAEPSLKVSTGHYSVYNYDPNPSPNPAENTPERVAKRTVWKGQQTIDIQSKNAKALLDVVGKIQEQGFAMNQLVYTLSDEQQEAYKDSLIALALKKIKERAALVAKTLDKGKYNIVEVNIDNAMPFQPMPVMMKMERGGAMMADAAMAAPVAEGTEQQVSMTVNARVILKP
jgi:uncharacterized protein